MEMWLNAAGEYGMTAVIAFYLLHRMEKKLDTLIYVVQGQQDPVSSLVNSPPEGQDNQSQSQVQ
ncbi:YvrJ family protein [Salibacterium aidingense]|uniref:YvrJ family protein n=1 Tax=Salibacterium aidingense TaxID=384933 RepID=UPI00041BD2D7|nr:YvrJ family protein [Salibacterium aidingense]